MENTVKENTDVKGWGVDADPKNDPTYPMKHRTDDEHKGYSWPRPPMQPKNVEILQSNERYNLPAVFGTAVPPFGLSGRIRRFAFKFGEGSYGHWLPLVLADRINVIEGIVDDLSRGYIPNIFAERGMRAEWKYNRKGVLKKMAMGVAVTSAAFLLLFYRSKNHSQKS